MKLNKQAEKEAAKENDSEAQDNDTQSSFGEDVWKAVFTLNLFRYVLALFLLASSVFVNMDVGLALLTRISHPNLFFSASVVLLISAIAFTYITSIQHFELSKILICQFAVDLMLAALLTHATGSIVSGFSMLYLLVVTTGSVVLTRKFALGLASGAIILMFYEHFYSLIVTEDIVSTRYDLLAGYGIFLMALASMVSYLALRIRTAEKKSFVPGTEAIEDFLVREEVNALKSALESTEGNKTEAAKLLGMTFRSFRYKITKYDLD